MKKKQDEVNRQTEDWRFKRDEGEVCATVTENGGVRDLLPDRTPDEHS